MNISEKIKILRLKNNIKASDLANYMEVSTETIRLWESGLSIPRNRNIFKLAKILNVDVDIFKNNDLNISDATIIRNDNNIDKDFRISAAENDSSTIYSNEFKEILNKNGQQIGRKITRIRLDQGITQKELAIGAETVQGTISRIEKGELQSVSIKILKRVTDFLGIDITSVIGEVTEDKAAIPETGDISDIILNPISKTSDNIINSTMGKIRELIEWKEKEMITNDEFNRFKAKIINDARI